MMTAVDSNTTLTYEEALSRLRHGESLYLRGEDGIIIANNLTSAGPNVMVYRQVTDADVGRAMPDGLRDARDKGYGHVSIRDLGYALSPKVTHSLLSTDDEVRKLAQEISGTSGWRNDLGRVEDYMRAIGHMNAFYEYEFDIPYDPKADPLDSFPDLTCIPIAYSTIEDDIKGTDEVFEIQVSCDLIHAEVTTDISYFEPMVERFDDLTTMDQKFLYWMEFDSLFGWYQEIEESLVSDDGPLHLIDPSMRDKLTNESHL